MSALWQNMESCLSKLDANAWLEDKKKDGWVYGEVKDAEAKTHPCIVPFEELPEFQKKKDALFCAIVDSLSANKMLTITKLK